MADSIKEWREIKLQHFDGSHKLNQDVELMNWLLSDKNDKSNNAFTDLTELVWAGGRCTDTALQEVQKKFSLTDIEANELGNILRIVEFVHDQIGDYNTGKRSHGPTSEIAN